MTQDILQESATKRRIYFISDVHLGAPWAARPPRKQESALIGFLRSVRRDAGVLYILGDLFNFWFEYRTVVPSSGARVLFELYNLVQAGTRVVYLPGNHDIWLGPYLSEQVGLELLDGPMVVSHQGRRLFIAHGDEFGTAAAFRFSRVILKNPLCIALFRLLHPDLGHALARAVSRISEFRTRRRSGASHETLSRTALDVIAEGADYFICGHYHRPIEKRLGTGRLIVLGDWIRRDTYAVMEDSHISLRNWAAR